MQRDGISFWLCLFRHVRLADLPVFHIPVTCLLLWQSAHSADAPRPNIVFVLLDDMGYADLGCMGAKDIKTPHIDRLASEGLRFTDFYANAPVCTPTRTAFITGRWQQRLGLEWALGYTAEQYRRVDGRWVAEPDKLALGLPASETTIAELLKKQGYATGCFGKWHLGYQPEFNPTRQGFDEYFGVLLGHTDFYRYNYFDGTYQLRDGEQPVKAEGYLTDLISQRAAKFVQQHAKQPFFLYVPYNAVHWPFQPPNRPLPALTRENAYDGDRRTYAAMLERVDDGVGLLLAELEKQGVLDSTLFVLSSDNGGERFSDNAPLFHHKQTLWEGGIRVPCLMRWPARLPRGKVVTQPAITMDLTATFLAAANVAGTLRVPSPGKSPAIENDGARSVPATLDGIDLLPILLGQEPPRERTFCWRVNRSNRQMKAVRHGDWKYVQDAGVEVLVNLKDDIGERRDLAFRHPDILADLKSRLKAWEEEMDRSPPAFVVR
jgi:arylsulfatase A-like enzyme